MSTSIGDEELPLYLSVSLSREQAKSLLNDPEQELVIYYPDGTRVIVRVEEQLGADDTVH